MSQTGGSAALRHHHGGQRRDQQELDDPWLGQGDVGPDGRPRPPGSPAREGGRLNGHVACSLRPEGSPGTRRRAPVRLAGVSRRRTPTVSPSLSHRLNVLALVLTALIVVTGAAVRLTGSGLGCSRLARVLGRAPDPGAAVPRPGRVREPPGHGRPDRGGGGRLPRLGLPRAPPARPGLAERRAGGRRAGPGRPRAASSSTPSSTPTSSWCTSSPPCSCWSTRSCWSTAPAATTRPGSAHLLVPRPLIRLFYGAAGAARRS